MYKYYIVSALAIALNFTAAKAITRDSIGVENRNGKKVILHQIVAKDTYYSLGRRYSVVPKDIMTFNDSKFLQLGVIIKVPTNLPYSSTAPTADQPTATTGGLVAHIVQKKENLNMLAEKYGTTVNEIKRINNLNTINLSIGQRLNIPSSAGEPVNTSPVVAARTEPEKPVEKKVTEKPVEKPIEKTLSNQVLNNPAQGEEELIVHTVASNETMYSIATRYKLSMDQLKAKNNLKDNSLGVGQKLLIKGQYPVKKPYVPAVANQADQDSLNSIKDPSLRYAASRYGLSQIEEKGTAVWIADADLDPTKMLVLHRTATIGKVIKITNPMTNRTTFAKVVGKFTENESTKDVIIVMTKAVADALGALDKRFYCNLIYGGEENEQ